MKSKGIEYFSQPGGTRFGKGVASLYGRKALSEITSEDFGLRS